MPRFNNVCTFAMLVLPMTALIESPRFLEDVQQVRASGNDAREMTRLTIQYLSTTLHSGFPAVAAVDLIVDFLRRSFSIDERTLRDGLAEIMRRPDAQTERAPHTAVCPICNRNTVKRGGSM